MCQLETAREINGKYEGTDGSIKSIITGNVFDKLHTMPIQSKDTGVERLLRNWKRHRAREHTKQRVKVAEVAEATELSE
jgi:hypothetical protein